MQNLDPKNLLKMEKETEVLESVVNIETIIEMVRAYPNDMELGSKIRKLINSIKD